MKINNLKITNIGKLSDVDLKLEKPLIILYGEVKQGKSSVLNCVRWVCGGEFPQDIIQHGKEEASIELGFEGGMIARSFYRAKDGTTKARPVVFVKNGKPVSSPVSELRKFLNPFLLDQDFLRNKTALERKAYFSELFAVDTKALDMELFEKGRDATALRSKISGYGTIDLTEVKRVDVTDLQAKLAEVRSNYSSKKSTLETELQNLTDGWELACENVDAENEKIRAKNSEIDSALDKIANLQSDIQRLKKELAEKCKRQDEIAEWCNANPKSELVAKPAAPDRTDIQKRLLAIVPDTTELERQISDAGATNVRAEQYEANKARHEQKVADENKLTELETRQRAIRKEKQAKLKEVTDSCGIKGLAFDGEGSFIYEDTSAEMISDSQIMKLSAELSNIYPEGFGLQVLDRGESLGRSIFEYVEMAKKNSSTILATVVGEKPAKVPEEIGVFVVVEGELQS